MFLTCRRGRRTPNLASLADLKRTRTMDILRRRFLLMSASAFAMSCPILGAIPSDVDVAVIGVGMAGLAAEQRLRAGVLRVAVSETRTRVCGREFTEHQNFGVPFNHSCGWTHADAANPFVQIANRFGFGKIWTPISHVCSTRMGKCPRWRTCAWTLLTVVYKQ